MQDYGERGAHAVHCIAPIQTKTRERHRRTFVRQREGKQLTMGSRAGEPECYDRWGENRAAVVGVAVYGGGRRRGGGGVSLPWAARRSPRGRGGNGPSLLRPA